MSLSEMKCRCRENPGFRTALLDVMIFRAAESFRAGGAQCG